MRLPTVELRPARGARPSAATPRPTDLGLGEVARSLEGWAGEVEQTRRLEEEVARSEAEEAVRPILERYETEADAEFNQAGAEWDGVEPGFARRATGRLAERRRGFGEELPLTSTERDALERGLNRHAEGVSQKAIQYESQRRGALAVEAASAREGAVLGRLTGDYLSALGEKQAEIDAAFDGSTDDYEARLLAEHDLVAERLIAEAPEHLRPRVSQQMGQQRLQLQARAMDVQQRGTAAYVAAQVRQGGDATLNALIAAPSMYEQAVANVETLTAPLPAAARGAERSRLLDGYTDAYVGGLIRDGQHDQAIALLEGGTLDTRLRPDTKARLLDQAVRKRDEPTLDDMVQMVEAEELMRSNLASVGATGQEVPGAGPADLADRLSPAQLADYVVNLEQARRLNAATPTLSTMTDAQLREHLEAQRPVPGAPDFAEGQQRFQVVQQQVAAEIKSREDDPAAWAITASPTLRRYMEGMGSADPAVRRRSGAAYAALTVQTQIAAGIPVSQQRLFPKGTAQALVEAAEGQQDPAAGLEVYASRLTMFEAGPGATWEQRIAARGQRDMAVNELLAAGGEAHDLSAALNLSGPALGAYVAGDRSGWAELDEDDQERIGDHVRVVMGDWLRSKAGERRTDPLARGMLDMVGRMAAGRMQTRGVSREAAINWAADQVNGRFTYVGAAHLRVPRAVAERRSAGRVATGPRGIPTIVTGDRAVQQGASQIIADLGADDGAGFWDPQDRPDMNAGQRRALYADRVRRNGRWVARPDDSGADFVYRNNEGRWVNARDARGQRISGDWDDLIAGRLPMEAPQARPARPRRPAPAGGAPRAVRNRNPLNIRPNGDQWRGMTGVDRTGTAAGFVTFDSVTSGARAAAVDLTNKWRRGLDNVHEIVSTWAPRSENDTPAYVAAVSRAMGVGPRARLNLDDPAVLARLMLAMADHESGRGHFTLQQMLAGVRAR